MANTLNVKACADESIVRLACFELMGRTLSPMLPALKRFVQG